MKNYRIATKHDIKCLDCVHWVNPFFKGQRGRCGCGGGVRYAVSKRGTCDNAHHEKCKKCNDTGSIRYYYDAGDHFGAGTAPGSGWRTKICECKNK